MAVLVALRAQVAEASGCPANAFVATGATADGGLSTGARVLCQRVTFDPTGLPVATWADDSTGAFEVYLRVFDGGWSGLGHSGDPGGLSLGAGNGSGRPSCWGQVRFDSQRRAVGVWMQNAGTQLVPFVQRWNGTQWEGVGGSATGTGLAPSGQNTWWPTLGLSEGDELTVAFTAGTTLTLVRWNGSAWVSLGESGTGLVSTATAHSKVVRPNGEITLAWTDNRSTPFEIRALVWDGGAWGPLGSSNDDGGLAQGDKVRVIHDQGGRPALGWEARGDDGGLEVTVARWIENQWVKMTPVPGGQPSLAVDSVDHLLLMVREDTEDGGSVLRLWASVGDTGWERCANTFPTGADPSWPELSVGPRNALLVGWFESRAGGGLESQVALSTPPPPVTRPMRENLAVGCACDGTAGWSLACLALLLARSRRSSRA